MRTPANMDRRFQECLSASRKRWKPFTEAEQLCQIIGATHGYTTAKVCREIGLPALEEIRFLMGRRDPAPPSDTTP